MSVVYNVKMTDSFTSQLEKLWTCCTHKDLESHLPGEKSKRKGYKNRDVLKMLWVYLDFFFLMSHAHIMHDFMIWNVVQI